MGPSFPGPWIVKPGLCPVAYVQVKLHKIQVKLANQKLLALKQDPGGMEDSCTHGIQQHELAS
jgi:hypothetical protein